MTGRYVTGSYAILCALIFTTFSRFGSSFLTKLHRPAGATRRELLEKLRRCSGDGGAKLQILIVVCAACRGRMYSDAFDSSLNYSFLLFSKEALRSNSLILGPSQMPATRYHCASNSWTVDRDCACIISVNFLRRATSCNFHEAAWKL